MKKLNILREKAIALDLADPLKDFRAHFALPAEKTYLCSHSLGLPAKNSTVYMQEQMQKWANQGAHGWFCGNDNWYDSFNQQLYKYLSMVLGACENEVVVMNSLTVNLHLLLTSFYQPSQSRFKILIDEPVFPSDLYAIKSHLKLHGLNPEQALLSVKPRHNESTIRLEDIQQVINNEGEQIALVFLNIVNYLTGQVLDIKPITILSHQKGCIMGVNIAHAAGNIPLTLHDDQIDFAVGCSYKYLCSGPGGPGIAFIHKNHHDKDLLRLAGWWGNHPATRFQMDQLPNFIPFGGALSWQVSTPSILSLQPLLASLKLFVEADMACLRKKSLLQTDFLLELLSIINGDFQIITPTNSAERGSQVSIKLSLPGKNFTHLLIEHGFICDFRPPNMLRIAPSPLYNSYQNLYDFILCFKKCLELSLKI